MSDKTKKPITEQNDPLLDKPIDTTSPDKSKEDIRQTGQKNRESTNVVPDNKTEVLQNKKSQPVASEQDKNSTHVKGVKTDQLQGTKDVENFDKDMVREMKKVDQKSKRFRDSFDTIFQFMGIDNPNIKTAPFNAKAVEDNKKIITDMKQSEYEKKSIKEQNTCGGNWDTNEYPEPIVEGDYDPLLDENGDNNTLTLPEELETDDDNNTYDSDNSFEDNSIDSKWLRFVPEPENGYIPRYSEQELLDFYGSDMPDDLDIDPNTMTRKELEDLMSEVQEGTGIEENDYENRYLPDHEPDYEWDQPITEQIGYKVFLDTVDLIKNRKITKESAISKFKTQQGINSTYNPKQSKIFTRIYKGLELLDTKKK